MSEQITFLRLPRVMDRTGFSRPTIYSLMLKRLFPRPIPILARHVAWLESTIDAYCKLKAERASDDDIKAFVESVAPPDPAPRKRRRPLERARIERVRA
jgi:prophage regulatory protein